MKKMSKLSEPVSIGSIKLGEKVTVSDPCYEPGIWCAGELTVNPGRYDCSLERIGGRVAQLTIVRNGCRNPYFGDEAEFGVGVDSGLAGFFDSEYFKSVKPNEECGNVWYEEALQVLYTEEKTCEPFQTGTILNDAGVFSSTGWGDGCYSCYYHKNADGVIEALRIVFIEEEFEDEEEFDSSESSDEVDETDDIEDFDDSAESED